MNSQLMGFLCQISICHIWPEAGLTQITVTHCEAIAIAKEIWFNLGPRWFARAETLLTSKVAFEISIYLFFVTNLGQCFTQFTGGLCGLLLYRARRVEMIFSRV